MFAKLHRALTVKRPRDGDQAKAVAGGKPSDYYPFGLANTGLVEREQHIISVAATLLNGGASRPRWPPTWTAWHEPVGAPPNHRLQARPPAWEAGSCWCRAAADVRLSRVDVRTR